MRARFVPGASFPIVNRITASNIPQIAVAIDMRPGAENCDQVSVTRIWSMPSEALKTISVRERPAITIAAAPKPKAAHRRR